MPGTPVVRRWIGPANGRYDDPDNWSPAGVPARGDDVILLAGAQPVAIHVPARSIASGATMTTIGEGGPVSLLLDGNLRNAGEIRASFGTLDINVGTGLRLVNTGSIAAVPGIGNAYVTVTLDADSTFRNAGAIHADAGPVGGLMGTVSVLGVGRFVNTGTILADGGTFALTFDGSAHNRGNLVASGASGSATVSIGTTFGTTSHYINSGSIMAADGAHIVMRGLPALETRYGDVTNRGMIHADGGHIEIDGNLHQTRSGRVLIEHGGSVTLDRAGDGTIEIRQGMLEFGGFGRAPFGPYGASGFDGTVAFIGETGAIGFSGVPVVETFRPISDTLAELLVGFADGRTLPDGSAVLARIQLAGQYDADQFRTVGDTIVYAAHPDQTQPNVSAVMAENQALA
ncbi:MAG: hypothetical protein AB7F35_20475 [Acetobacteraceae bacterium]